jgi:hypothetical protein
MAKRTPQDQQEYRPVKEELARSVLARRRIEPTASQPDVAVGAESNPPALAVESIEQSPTPEPVLEAKAVRRTEAAAKDAKQKDAEAESTTPVRKDLVREKRMLLTVSEEQDLKNLVRDISDELGVSVNTSNVLRACLVILNHARDELRKQCRRHGKIAKRPRNNELTGIVVFEQTLAKILDGSIRNSKSLS